MVLKSYGNSVPNFSVFLYPISKENLEKQDAYIDLEDKTQDFQTSKQALLQWIQVCFHSYLFIFLMIQSEWSCVFYGFPQKI